MFSGISFYGVKIYLLKFLPTGFRDFFPNGEVWSWQKLGEFLINKGVEKSMSSKVSVLIKVLLLI